jgi:chloramphenicol-sensitive protein RarD
MSQSIQVKLREGQDDRLGILYGLAAFGAWGFAPLFFKAVSHVGSLEVLAHRIVWTVVLMLPIILLTGRWKALREILTSRSKLATLSLTSVLIAINWLSFIWGIANGYTFQISLGYFINPLVSMAMGYIILSERLRRNQWFSVTLAGLGVGILIAQTGTLPWISVLVAVSFGFYGLLRKRLIVDAVAGMTVEAAVLMPIALGYMLILYQSGELHFVNGTNTDRGLLMFAGLMTAQPLIWFAAAAKRIRLTTVGFLQYLAPTGHFLCAIYFGDPYEQAYRYAFPLIWGALILYSWDLIQHASRRRPTPPKAS